MSEDFEYAILEGLNAAAQAIQAEDDVSFLARKVDAALASITQGEVRAGVFGGEGVLSSIQRTVAATLGGLEKEDLPPETLALVAYTAIDRHFRKEICTMRPSRNGYPIAVIQQPDLRASCSDLEALEGEVRDILKKASFGLKLEALKAHVKMKQAQSAISSSIALPSALDVAIEIAETTEASESQISSAGDDGTGRSP